jgi:glycerophosphoryl diester phosphodiesterase
MNKKLMLSFSSLILLICTPFIFVSCSSSNKITYNAHRGLSSQYFENTKDAFIAAGQNKYFDGIETDVYLTMDYNIVCSHAKNPFRVLPSDQTISYQKDGYNYDTNQEQNSGKSFIYENTYAETVNREL